MTAAAHRYRLYGLELRSEILLPELQVGDSGKPDVTVSLGQVPDPPDECAFGDLLFQTTSRGCWLGWRGLGRFFVEGGRSITVQPDAKADAAALRVFILGSVFGALLHQRGVLPLHASAVRLGAGCVAFLGDSGEGKSTLAAAFVRAGASLVADDVLVVAETDGALTVWPAYPQLKLAEGTADRLGWPTRDLERGSVDRKIALPTRERFVDEAVELLRLYVLVKGGREPSRIEGVEGFDKVEALINHTYRLWLVDAATAGAAHLQLACRLASRVPVRRLVRGDGDGSPRRLRQLVEGDD